MTTVGLVIKTNVRFLAGRSSQRSCRVIALAFLAKHRWNVLRLVRHGVLDTEDEAVSPRKLRVKTSVLYVGGRQRRG